MRHLAYQLVIRVCLWFLTVIECQVLLPFPPSSVRCAPCLHIHNILDTSSSGMVVKSIWFQFNWNVPNLVKPRVYMADTKHGMRQIVLPDAWHGMFSTTRILLQRTCRLLAPWRAPRDCRLTMLVPLPHPARAGNLRHCISLVKKNSLVIWTYYT